MKRAATFSLLLLGATGAFGFVPPAVIGSRSRAMSTSAAAAGVYKDGMREDVLHGIEPINRFDPIMGYSTADRPVTSILSTPQHTVRGNGEGTGSASGLTRGELLQGLGATAFLSLLRSVG